MRLHRTFLVGLLAFAGLAVVHPAGASAKDEVVLRSAAWAVNNRGEIVGESSAPSGETRAVRWVGVWGPIDLGTLGGANSVAYGVNDLGVVVGASDTASGARHAFAWSGDAGMTDLGGLPGASECAAVDVNDRGEAAGYCMVPFNARHVVLWSGGRVIDLGDGEAYGINDRGEVLASCEHGALRVVARGSTHCAAGTLLESSDFRQATGHFGELNDAGEAVTNRSYGGPRAVLWAPTDGGGYGGTVLSDPGAGESQMWDLNERTEAVGVMNPNDAARRAVLWANGSATDLGTLGGTNSWASGINDRGAVVGGAHLAGDATSHAFLWNRGTMTDLGTLTPLP